jgi:hypothetical protein
VIGSVLALKMADRKELGLGNVAFAEGNSLEEMMQMASLMQ